MGNVKTITKYQTTDGLEFRQPDDAEAWQEKIDKLADSESAILGSRPDSCDWFNGSLGYIQHSIAARRLILNELKEAGATRDSGGYIGQLLSRMWCIDDAGREWGQPYFANNPDHGSSTDCYEDRR